MLFLRNRLHSNSRNWFYFTLLPEHRTVPSSEFSLYLKMKLQFVKFHNIEFFVFTNLVNRILDKTGNKIINSLKYGAVQIFGINLTN